MAALGPKAYFFTFFANANFDSKIWSGNGLYFWGHVSPASSFIFSAIAPEITYDRWIFSLFEMEAYFEKKHFISFNFQGTNWTREPNAKFGGFFVPHNLLENGVTSQISLAVDKKRPKMSNRQLAIFLKFHRWQFWSWSSEIHSLAISTGQKVRKSGHVINLKRARTYNPKEKFQATDLW